MIFISVPIADRAEGPSHKATLTYWLLPVAENSAVLGDPVQLSSF